MEASSAPKRCFVVMGFGLKTDYATGRQLDLNKSYQFLIKPAVEDKGLVCIRADEIRHSGTIDLPMYRELLTADVVIADVSTANPNALYELGVRHALRPWTTIVISESRLAYPFDLNHVLITSYTHLGEGIDYGEVLRFRKLLGETLDTVLKEPRTDSPVYTFLGQLTPPTLGKAASQAIAQAGKALERAGEAVAKAVDSQKPASPVDNETLALLVEQGEQAIKGDRFSDAVKLFTRARKLCNCPPDDDSIPAPQDPYLVQRLVLATYKSKQPDELSALTKAKELLACLNPEDSNDPETVGLAGAIEKRLFDRGQGEEHLSQAIWYYGRGYYLRDDRYNGINLAYLLNIRTDTPLDATKEEKIADLVWANRIRSKVIPLCERELRDIRVRGERTPAEHNQIQADQEARDQEQKFWALATQAEAYFGLGDLESYERTRSEAEALHPAKWMMDTFNDQIVRLKSLLDRHGHLLNPSWPGLKT